MGTYLIPGARSILEAQDYLAGTGAPQEASWTLLPNGIQYSVAGVDDATAASHYAGFVPKARDASDWPAMPPVIRTAAIDIRADAALTDAQIDATFPAGPMRRLAYGHRAACRALLWLNRQLNEE